MKIIPTLNDIDKKRTQNLRPSVIGCIIHDQKLLVFYKKQYSSWTLPQGRITNNTGVDEAFMIKMTEELGQEFATQINSKITNVYEGHIVFSENSWGKEDLQDDRGNKFEMKGKYYYFIAASSNSNELNIKETEFDDFIWASKSVATYIFDKIPIPSKQILLKEAVKALGNLDLIK